MVAERTYRHLNILGRGKVLNPYLSTDREILLSSSRYSYALHMSCDPSYTIEQQPVVSGEIHQQRANLVADLPIDFIAGITSER